MPSQNRGNPLENLDFRLPRRASTARNDENLVILSVSEISQTF
ncbi:hypothetical protein ACWIWK_04405 [Helicobacter sp. 23-1048]